MQNARMDQKNNIYNCGYFNASGPIKINERKEWKRGNVLIKNFSFSRMESAKSKLSTNSFWYTKKEAAKNWYKEKAKFLEKDTKGKKL